MFALLGTAEVLALLVVGGFVAPMFMTPSRRGGPLLLARRVEVNYDRWPAVLIMAAHAGFAPWLLRLINQAPITSLEATPEGLNVHIGGVFRGRTRQIPYTTITDVDVQRKHPMYHIAAMSVAGFVMLVWAMVDRLTLQRFEVGSALVVLIAALAAAESTNNLVIDEGRKTFFLRRKKPLVLPFSKLSLSRKYPAVTDAKLTEVAARIMQLVNQAKNQAA